ncbi:MAG: DUF167 domain-containing protein [candidate division WOR-3 bacterium]|nr:MAG: DUF167 domain-containing protein [candidate division WOR-3 bacterium]
MKKNSRVLLSVRVIPRSKKNEVSDLGNNRLRVRVISPPERGRANKELVELLARHYRKRRSSITIAKGLTSRDKIVEISD